VWYLTEELKLTFVLIAVKIYNPCEELMKGSKLSDILLSMGRNCPGGLQH
jgi:hypothetical protein